MRAPTRFDILSAQGNSSEATSLKALGPYVQNTHNPGDLQGDLESPCTRFFGVSAQPKQRFL